MLPLLLALTLATPQSEDPVAAWTEDTLLFLEQLERLHPDPWFGCPREDFEAAVDGFLGGLEGQRESERVAGFLRLVARLAEQGRDGHSLAWPMTSRTLPLQVYGFADGWFVVGAPQAERVGARLVSVGGVPVEEACGRLAPLLTADNEWNRREKLALALVTLDLLDGVGLAESPERARVVLEQAGTRTETLLEGEPADPHRMWGRPVLPARGGAAWLEGRERFFAWQVLEPERALYVQFNEVRAQDARGRTLEDHAREMVATFEQRGLTRLVLDVRLNGGGDNTTFGPLIAALQHPSLARPGVLYGLIGRSTFSAAGNFAAALGQDTQALLVGEPTGGAPNQYGDARDVRLPNHPALLVRLSTRYHQFGPADDARLAVEPDLGVPLTSGDYFAGRDPVLRAALEHVPPR
ncbi:MAG TPA: hypothetical protein VF530_17180 [Planctomycetota bacterium]